MIKIENLFLVYDLISAPGVALAPTFVPTQSPTIVPTLSPTFVPSMRPTLSPIQSVPSFAPSSQNPSQVPSVWPTSQTSAPQWTLPPFGLCSLLYFSP